MPPKQPQSLADLLASSDLTGEDVDDLVAAIKAAIIEQAERERFIHRALAALNAQGKSFDQIAVEVGITRSKANRLARLADRQA